MGRGDVADGGRQRGQGDVADSVRQRGGVGDALMIEVGVGGGVWEGVTLSISINSLYNNEQQALCARHVYRSLLQTPRDSLYTSSSHGINTQ